MQELKKGRPGPGEETRGPGVEDGELQGGPSRGRALPSLARRALGDFDNSVGWGEASVEPGRGHQCLSPRDLLSRELRGQRAREGCLGLF